MKSPQETSRSVRKAGLVGDIWYEQAGVRSPSARRFGAVRIRASKKEPGHFFSIRSIHPSLPAVLAGASPKKVLHFELLRLYRHLRFTTQLENFLILPAFHDIACGKLGKLSRELSVQALRMGTDEAFHGQRSEELIQYLEGVTGVACPFELSNDRYLESVIGNDETIAQKLSRFCFAFVSETIISSTISKNSKEVKDPEVRAFFREHLRDESAHSIFFQAVFAILWPKLPAQIQREQAPNFGRHLRSFVSPDWESVIGDLRSAALVSQANALTRQLSGDEKMRNFLDRKSAEVTLSTLIAVDRNRSIVTLPFFKEVCKQCGT